LNWPEDQNVLLALREGDQHLDAAALLRVAVGVLQSLLTVSEGAVDAHAIEGVAGCEHDCRVLHQLVHLHDAIDLADLVEEASRLRLVGDLDEQVDVLQGVAFLSVGWVAL
jgi:hypothetical protein